MDYIGCSEKVVLAVTNSGNLVPLAEFSIVVEKRTVAKSGDELGKERVILPSFSIGIDGLTHLADECLMIAARLREAKQLADGVRVPLVSTDAVELDASGTTLPGRAVEEVQSDGEETSEEGGEEVSPEAHDPAPAEAPEAPAAAVQEGD
jgi:hypothetical protein